MIRAWLRHLTTSFLVATCLLPNTAGANATLDCNFELFGERYDHLRISAGVELAAINNQGVAAGFFGPSSSPGPGAYAVTWDDENGLQRLISHDHVEQFSWATDINDNGVVVGVIRDIHGIPGVDEDAHANEWAFSWHPDTGLVELATIIPGIGGSQNTDQVTSAARAINNRGDIVLLTNNGGGLMWDGSSLVDLPNGPGCEILGNGGGQAVNNAGQVAGTAAFQNDNAFCVSDRAVIWSSGGTPTIVADDPAAAWDINDAGDVVGVMTDVDTGAQFAMRNGVMLPGLTDSRASTANAINNNGLVVGRVVGETLVTAALWDSSSNLVDLHAIHDAQCEQFLPEQQDINDAAEMVGDNIIIRPAKPLMWVSSTILGDREADIGEFVFSSIQIQNLGSLALSNFALAVNGEDPEMVERRVGPNPELPSRLEPGTNSANLDFTYLVTGNGTTNIEYTVTAEDDEGRQITITSEPIAFVIDSPEPLVVDIELPQGKENPPLDDTFTTNVAVTSNQTGSVTIRFTSDGLESSDTNIVALSSTETLPDSFILTNGETRTFAYTTRTNSRGQSELLAAVSSEDENGLMLNASDTALIDVESLNVAIETTDVRETQDDGSILHRVTFRVVISNQTQQTITNVTIPGNIQGLVVTDLLNLGLTHVPIAYRPPDPDPFDLLPDSSQVFEWDYEISGLVQRLNAETLVTGFLNGNLTELASTEFEVLPLEVTVQVPGISQGLLDLPEDKLFFVQVEVVNNGLTDISNLALLGSQGVQMQSDFTDQATGELAFVIGPSPALPTVLAPGERSQHEFLLKPDQLGPIRLVASATGTDGDGQELLARGAMELAVEFLPPTPSEMREALQGLALLAIAELALGYEEFHADVAAMMDEASNGNAAGNGCAVTNSDRRSPSLLEREMADAANLPERAFAHLPSQANSSTSVLRDIFHGTWTGKAEGHAQYRDETGNRFGDLGNVLQMLATDPAARQRFLRVMRDDIGALPGSMMHTSIRALHEPDQMDAFRAGFNQAVPQIRSEIEVSYAEACADLASFVDQQRQLVEAGDYFEYARQNNHRMAYQQSQIGAFIFETMLGIRAERMVAESGLWRFAARKPSQRYRRTTPRQEAAQRLPDPPLNVLREVDDSLVRQAGFTPADLVPPQTLIQGVRQQDVGRMQSVLDEWGEFFGIELAAGVRPTNPFSAGRLFDADGVQIGSIKEELLKPKGISIEDVVIFGAPIEQIGSVGVFTPRLDRFNSLPEALQRKFRPRLETLLKIERDYNNPASTLRRNIDLATQEGGHVFEVDRVPGDAPDRIFQHWSVQEVGDAGNTRLILDAANGNRPHGGDIDLAYLIDARTNRPVNPAIHNIVMNQMRARGVTLARHGAALNMADFGPRMEADIKVRYLLEGMAADVGEPAGREFIRRWNAEKALLNADLQPGEAAWRIYDEDDFIRSINFNDFALRITRDGVRIDAADTPILTDLPIRMTTP